MQNSGFLDLTSLMTLTRTAKAHAFDELSITLLIEHEITRNHKCDSIEEAIDFWRKVHRKPHLKQWLSRDRSTVESIRVNRNMLSRAVSYEVMFAKMLRTVPESDRLPVVSEKGPYGMTMLHQAALLGKLDCIKMILPLYPESELRLHAVSRRDKGGRTVLHCSVISSDIETIKHIHSVYPEAEREQAVRMQDHEGYTVWRHATQSRDPETIEYILAVMPESERLQILNMKDKNGRTALHCAISWRGKPIECIKVILAFHPESQRLHVLNSQDQSGKTVLHYAAELNDVERIIGLLALYPESERLPALSMQDREGKTVLQYMDEKTRGSITELLPESESATSIVITR